MKIKLIFCAFFVIHFILVKSDKNINSVESPSKTDFPGRAALDNFPLIDGHNDLPNNLKILIKNQLKKLDFNSDWKENTFFKDCAVCHTDLPKLKRGKLGAQFWAAYVDCENSTNPVSDTLEQIDVIKRLINKYSNDLVFATNSDDILKAFKQHRIASFIGVEGGHSIDNKLSILRSYYELGVRYLTLTHVCDLNWADSATVDKPGKGPVNNLTDFGKTIVLEMNRLGMMVDLSHVSENVMLDTLQVSRAPVIFSHSSAKKIYSHIRNVNDKVLKILAANGGIIMVNFYSKFIGENATIRDVADHINHIVDTTGIDHVGIGSDFDGVSLTPYGLEDVSKYPNLFDILKELNPKRWTINNLEKLAGRNFVRVFKKVEEILRNVGCCINFRKILMCSIPFENLTYTPPCTIILMSTDLKELPIEELLVLCKQIFRFGVKTLEKKGEQIFLKLSYSPKSDTMKLKLGNFPVKYVRLGVETDEEIEILKTYMKKYEFDLSAIENEEHTQQQAIVDHARKRKATTTNSPPTKQKKNQILENRILHPSTSTSFVELYDEDAHDPDSQKYTVKFNLADESPGEDII